MYLYCLLGIIRKYLGWRYGAHNAPILYPRLLMKLTDLRELNDQHTEYNLKLAKQEVSSSSKSSQSEKARRREKGSHIVEHSNFKGVEEGGDSVLITAFFRGDSVL